MTEESNYDSFVPDNIYVGTDSEFLMQSGSIKGSIEGSFPEIMRITRMIGTRSLNGLDMSAKIQDNTIQQNAITVDSNFLSMIPVPMLTGDRSTALDAMNSVIISERFANTWFPNGNALGQSIEINIQEQNETLTVTGIFRNMSRTVLPDCRHDLQAGTV